MIELSLLAQVIIWIVGIGIAIYIAVFQMFIGGLIEVITAVVDLFKESEDFEEEISFDDDELSISFDRKKSYYKEVRRLSRTRGF